MLLLGFERFVHPLCIMTTGSVALRASNNSRVAATFRSQGTLARTPRLLTSSLSISAWTSVSFHHRCVTLLRFFIYRHHVLCFDVRSPFVLTHSPFRTTHHTHPGCGGERDVRTGCSGQRGLHSRCHYRVRARASPGTGSCLFVAGKATWLQFRRRHECHTL